MKSHQWRVREAGCGALRDALVSRQWDEVRDLLDELWYVNFRAIGDIKEVSEKLLVVQEEHSLSFRSIFVILRNLDSKGRL